MTWRASVLTIFPEMFPGPLGMSLAGKALATGLWALDAIDIRDHATDKHRTVDDTPAGGGPGMVMKADVLARALDGRLAAGRHPPAPADEPARHAAHAGAGGDAGARAGRGDPVRTVRGRRRAHRSKRANISEISVGDYVLSGGEIAALALLDACVRLIPGVMGQEASAADESFSQGLLEYPQYTRPQEFEGRTIPEVLTSGDHAKVAAWRRAEAERLTRERRPDLWAKLDKPKGG